MEWMTTWDQVWDPAFVAQWEAWIDGSPNGHVFFHPAVARVWTDVYRGLRDIEPRFLVGRAGADAVAFLPLVYDRGGWKDGWVRVLQPVGFNEYDYHDPILTAPLPPATAAGFWECFARETARQGADLVSVPRVREALASGVPGFRRIESAPFIELAGFASYEDLVATRSRNLRQGLRRKRRRFEEEAGGRFRVFGPSEVPQARECLPRFRLAHEAKWPLAYRAPGFFERLVGDLLPLGLLHFSTLEAGGQPISWHLGFLHRACLYWYVPVYDAAWERFSPGQIHLAALVEEAVKRGCRTFDFLRGEERYKYEWTAANRGLFEYAAAGAGAGSRVRRRIRRSLRTAAERLRRGAARDRSGENETGMSGETRQP
jgi:CelD/BcsL family acetyltransferase involved in cellulose biosynthesis